jgi:outer membrane beta-barrel protein
MKFILLTFSSILMLLVSSPVHAGEDSLYEFLWLDPDKKVYVLQNKLYKKEKTFYFDAGYMDNLTSKFQNTNGFALRAGYYFHEEWGVEIFLNEYGNKNNDEYRNIRLVNMTEPFIRRPAQSLGALAIWSPFYGKINTFNKIFYFDWSFGAGVAQLRTQTNLGTVVSSSAVSKFENENKTAAVFKSKLRFHVTEHVNIGIEYMTQGYQAPGPRNPKQDKLRWNNDLIFSVGFSY